MPKHRKPPTDETPWSRDERDRERCGMTAMLAALTGSRRGPTVGAVKIGVKRDRTLLHVAVVGNELGRDEFGPLRDALARADLAPVAEAEEATRSNRAVAFIFDGGEPTRRLALETAVRVYPASVPLSEPLPV